MPKQKLTVDKFVKRANKIHDSKYDYSKVEYKTLKSKILVGCKIHGEFFTTPYRHIGQGCGCKKCAFERMALGNQLTTNDFVVSAKKVHGDKYDYTQVEYISSLEKVKIICKEHGEFFQTPSGHLSGYGCSKCAGNYSCTLSEFINKCRNVHGDKYDYSKTDYFRNKKKVIVGCKIHGDFHVTPADHINKASGCPKCANNVPTTEEFIKKCQIIHGNKYDYSKVEYVENKKKVIIGCAIHGDFLQRASSHLFAKCGCRKCTGGSVSKIEILFLNELGIPENFRQYPISGIGLVDGIDINIKTIYEFLGDYWHGNPKIFDANLMNKRAKKTFGSLYNKTFSRFDKLISRGYTIKYIWEHDWKLWVKNKTGAIPLIDYQPI
jgi:hypothetical protein